MPPGVCAVTSRWVANGALTTMILSPRSTQSSPSREAVVWTSCHRSPLWASAAASATTAVPEAISAKMGPATGLPDRSNRPAATTAVSTYGSMTRA